MKRIGGIAEAMASRKNVELAVHEARKRRNKDNELRRNAERFIRDREKSIAEVMEILRTGEWRIGGYRSFIRVEHGKERKIDWNPSFRDNVIQHAIHQTVGVRLNGTLIRDTFSGIKGRGTHHGMVRVMERIQGKYAKSPEIYVMKVDIRHYYESIDNELLKGMLSSKLKDPVIVKLLHTLVDSHPHGLPIGNFLSQLLANFYLSETDHWAVAQGMDYFRYCDDVVALSDSKEKLVRFMSAFENELKAVRLTLKVNRQIFPITRTNGLDFMGFTMTRDGVRLRKEIERNFRRSAGSFINDPCEHTRQSLEAFRGWTKWLTDGEALWDTVLGELDAA